MSQTMGMEMDIETAEPITMEFTRFGPCSFSEDEILAFPWGLPGFPNLRRWLALSMQDQHSYIWLQSVDDPTVAIPTADPFAIFESYEPRLPAYAVAALDITSASDFTMLGVVVVTENAEELTMNLFAPIVVNLRTRKGRQIMLENSGYAMREPIPRAHASEGAAS